MTAVWLAVLSAWAALSVPTATPVPAPHDVDVTSVARVFLDELGPGRYLLSVVDARVPPIVAPDEVVPERCEPLAPDDVGVRVASGFGFACSEPLGEGDVLALPWSLAGVVVLARWGDGSTSSAYFRGDRGRIPIDVGVLAGLGSPLRVAGTYMRIGAEHILLGVDHLLFVMGLLLLVHGLGPLVRTVTAFTVAHSLTLAASVFGLVPVDRAPIEAAIALSIVLLAREIVAAHRGEVNLTHRMPWLVAFVFGLLHGLGFAGALGDIGLPDGAIPLALLFFNLGVEAGQILFVLAMLGLYRSARGLVEGRRHRLRPVLGYALGALSTLWLLDRLPAVLMGG